MTGFKNRISSIGKKVNEEALSGIKLSDKLPEFRKSRKGTEIYILKGETKIRVYDDYSMYPESSGTGWRVRIYNIENGFFYDKACMKNGLYPTRERALAEVERFKNRADSLIFYILPINFSYDKEKLIWPDEEEEEFDYNNPTYATEEEQIEEAEKRVYYLTGKMNADVTDIVKKVKDADSMKALESFKRLQKEKKTEDYPFMIVGDATGGKSVLYVGADKSEWYSERCGIESESKEGYISAYVYNTCCPEYSEYGDIGYRYCYGKILRIA